MQMLDTVDWVGDGDELWFVSAIEDVFDLRLRARLPWTTFGEVRDHFFAHVAQYGRNGTKCATQMVFYRLRRARGLGRRVAPDAELSELVGANPVEWFNDLEADTDLKMPKTRCGRLGIAGGVCIALAVAVLAFTKLHDPFVVAAACAIAAAGLWVRSFDRRRLPHGCQTIGDLARMVAEQNCGRLARDGARLPEAQIWRIIQQLAAEETGVNPDQIGLETTFFRPKARAA